MVLMTGATPLRSRVNGNAHARFCNRGNGGDPVALGSAGRKGQQWTSLAAYPTSPHSTPTPMLQACRRMWNANFTTIYGVASWRMAFCAWAVIRARKKIGRASGWGRGGGV